VKGESRDSNFHPVSPVNAVNQSHSVPLLKGHGTPTIQVRIQGAVHTLIVDTGLCRSILKPNVTNYPIGRTDRALYGVTGDYLKVEAKQTVKF
jgi:hypothetical protein